jgi:hypothetical protein
VGPLYANTVLERIFRCELDLNGSAWDKMVSLSGYEPSGSIDEGKGFVDHLESKKFQKDPAPQNLYSSYCLLVLCAALLLINYALYV